jgi:hypothetical protein
MMGFINHDQKKSIRIEALQTRRLLATQCGHTGYDNAAVRVCGPSPLVYFRLQIRVGVRELITRLVQKFCTVGKNQHLFFHLKIAGKLGEYDGLAGSGRKTNELTPYSGPVPVDNRLKAVTLVITEFNA